MTCSCGCFSDTAGEQFNTKKVGKELQRYRRIRAGVRLENALRQRRTTFRTFVHPPTRMRQLVHDAGFDLVGHRQTLSWSADVFVRRPGAAALRRTEPDPDAHATG